MLFSTSLCSIHAPFCKLFDLLSIEPLPSLLRRQALSHTISRHIPSILLPLCHLPLSQGLNFIYTTTINMAGAQHQQQANPNKWQCHECHAGPYLYANTTRCTNIGSNNLPCNHDFCHARCKKDNDIPPPLSSTQSSSPGLHSAPNHSSSSRSLTLPSYTANFAVNNRIQHRGGGSTHARADSQSRNCLSTPRVTRDSAVRNNVAADQSRPPMAGWWKCCACAQWNNPSLTAGRCAFCQHGGPCPHCTMC